MKKILLVLTAMLIMALVSVSAYAQGQRPPQLDKEQKETMHQAIDDDNYDSWYSIMIDTLTPDWFERLVEEYNHRKSIENAIENNDYDAWKNAMSSRFSEEHFDRIKERPRMQGQGNQMQRPPGQMQGGQGFGTQELPFGRGPGGQGPLGQQGGQGNRPWGNAGCN